MRTVPDLPAPWPPPEPAGGDRTPSTLSVITQRRGPWHVLMLTGEFDLATAPRLLDYIAFQQQCQGQGVRRDDDRHPPRRRTPGQVR